MLVTFFILSLVTASPQVFAGGGRELERELQAALDAQADTSSDPQVLLKLADLYLDLGDEVYTDVEQRRAAYERGAQLADRAVALREADAEAHYLYAANAGSAAQLKGVMASALTIRDLKKHVKRALELRPDHAPSLHMMGMMLEELPWMLGGNAAEALRYLERAVAVDPQYEHARLDLAKAYVKRGNRQAARRELTIILHDTRDEAVRYHAEANRLLAALEGRTARPE